VDYSLLGPMTVADAGRPVELGVPRQRPVLTAMDTGERAWDGLLSARLAALPRERRRPPRRRLPRTSEM
jgi:hypothetical protein